MTLRSPKFFESQRQARLAANSWRTLRVNHGGVDLSSNDYLGISKRLEHPEVSEVILKELARSDFNGGIGSTGSRLVTGNSADHEQLEHFLAAFHGAQSALLFGSGYEANLGVLSSIATRNDTILYDEFVHASIRDGIRLSPARSYAFRHNDLGDLVKKLNAARGECFIAVESVYSMDGDIAPLTELCALVESAGAYLIVDEAHATGVYGDNGAGYVQQLGLSERVLARVHTFGKALGYRGACVVGSNALREHLVNLARSFIYTTAPDRLALAYIRQAYAILGQSGSERQRLNALLSEFGALKSRYPGLSFLESSTAIQGVLVPGNTDVLRAEGVLIEAGFAVRAIRAPTVPAGSERIRLCLHSFNSIDELTSALDLLSLTIEGTYSRVGGIDG